MVQNHAQKALAGIDLQHSHPKEGRLPKIESLRRFLPAFVFGVLLTIGPREVGEVGMANDDRALVLDRLQWLAVLLHEGHPQNFMALDKVLQSGLQCGQVQLSQPAQDDRNIVDSARPLQSINEPKAALRG
jgi:hypothetical protein